MKTVGSMKQLKNETSADLTALEKKGLDRKTNHQGLMKAETKEVAQRPPPWIDKHATIEYGFNSKRRCDRGESMVRLAPSYLEHKATSQEGVMNFMLHFNSSKHNTR